MADSYTSSSFYFSSTSTGDHGSTTTGHRYSTTSLTEADGTTIVRTARQDLGQPPIVEEHRYDSTGQEQLTLPGPGGSSAGGVRRITDLDEEGSSELSALDDADGSFSSGATPQFDGAAVPFGTRVVDVDTGAYDEHMHYYSDKSMRHHRELRDAAGRKFTRDVDFDPSGQGGTAHERRQFENPETGTKVEQDEVVQASEVI